MAEAATNESAGAEGSGVDAAEAARVEARAGALGWVPKEIYEQRGKDPSTWVDAATFVKRGRDFNKNQTRTIQQLQKEVETLRGTRQAFIELQTRENKALRQQLEEAERGARRAQEEARLSGDVDSVLAADDRIEAIRQEKAEAAAAAKRLEEEAKGVKAGPMGEVDLGDGRKAVPNPEYVAVMEEWIADGNQWFTSDPKMQRWAVDVGEALKRDFPDLQPRQFLGKVREVMEADFPHKFQRQQRSNKTTTTTARGAGAGRTTADLPEADRAIMRQLVAEGYYKSEQEFLNSYFSR